jgi:hypothetical protein
MPMQMRGFRCGAQSVSHPSINLSQNKLGRASLLLHTTGTNTEYGVIPSDWKCAVLRLLSENYVNFVPFVMRCHFLRFGLDEKYCQKIEHEK